MVSSPALIVWDRQDLEDSEQKDDSINKSMNELVTKVIVEQPRLYRLFTIEEKHLQRACRCEVSLLA